jgi:replicative DNA helicase
MTDEFLHQPPHSQIAEKSLLSLLMQNGEEAWIFCDESGVCADDFYFPPFRLLFQTLGERRAMKALDDLPALIEHLHATGKLDRCGGPSEVCEVYGYCLFESGIERRIQHWAGILREKRIGRELQLAAGRIIASVDDSPESIPEALAEAEKAITAISQGLIVTAKPPEFSELLERNIAALEARQHRKESAMGIPTIPLLDDCMRGLHPGRMIIVGGYPGAGKSLLTQQIGLAALLEGHAGFIWSAELSGDDATTRAIIQASRIPASVYADPGGHNGGEPMTKYQMQQIQRGVASLAKAPLQIYRATDRSLSAVVSCLRRAKRERRIEWAVVDYLQKIKLPPGSNPERGFAEISDTLYELAGELQIALLLPSQINQDGDTKGARAFEEGADFIANIVQDRDKDSETYKAHRHLLVVKDRHNGTEGQRIPLVLNRELLVFEEGADPVAKPKNASRFGK